MSSAATPATAAEGTRRLSVRLVTPEGVVLEGEAAMVVAPSVMGEVGVLARHIPLVASLRIGDVRISIDREQGEPIVFATTEGYLSVDEDTVLILVAQAERREEIDRPRAEAALARADARLAELPEDDEVQRAVYEAAKRRAENRLRVLDRE